MWHDGYILSKGDTLFLVKQPIVARAVSPKGKIIWVRKFHISREAWKLEAGAFWVGYSLVTVADICAVTHSVGAAKCQILLSAYCLKFD